MEPLRTIIQRKKALRITVRGKRGSPPITHSNFQGIQVNNSSSGVNLTPYSDVIYFGVILTPKRSLKNSFSGVKTTPDLELILRS